MPKTNDTKISKFMSYVLRHKASEFGLDIDDSGFVDLNKFIKVVQTNFPDSPVDVALISDVVDNNDKKRFAFDSNKTKIRAVQGHSGDVADSIIPEKLLTPITSNDGLNDVFHGTDKKAFDLIKATGLNKMTRQFIHLANGDDAISGARKSATVRIYVDIDKMLLDGIRIWKSDNNVILTDGIDGVLDPKYFKTIKILQKGKWLKL